MNLFSISIRMEIERGSDNLEVAIVICTSYQFLKAIIVFKKVSK